MSSCIENMPRKPLRSLVFSRTGQTTVEAAFLLPIIFLLLIMLCQPAILLYNRMVMNSAASEGCRLLATQTSSGSGSYAIDKCKGYVERRMASIPPVSIFHMHEGSCSYQIVLSGDENSATTKVSITNELKLLPLIGQGAQLLGLAEPGGIYRQKVEVSTVSRPNWAKGSPQEWQGRWD